MTSSANPGPDLALPESELSPEQRQRARRALALLAVLGTGSMVGVAFSFYLVNHLPLTLIALSPLGRHLVLVAPTVDPIAFLAVSVGRRLLFYLASYELGGAMGPRGVVWLEARAARFARFVRFIERWFARASRSVVLVFCGPTVSALAGISGMPRAEFIALATVSLLVRMGLLLGFSELLREPIEQLLGWIDAYWVQGTALMVAGVLAYQWVRIRRLRSANRRR